MAHKDVPPLADHHVHAQEICVHDPEIAEMFSLSVGKARWECPPVERFVQHVERNNLETIWLIYEDRSSFFEIKNAVLSRRPGCTVNGFYFVRRPLYPDEDEIQTLYSEGAVAGLKIHPVNDNFALLPEYVDPVIQVASRYQIPILYHSDDRTQTMHLTSPEYQKQIVSLYPDVTFVIGHGGAYAHPRLVGKSPQTRAYWATRGPLVLSALDLSAAHENVYYETSVLTNPVKAKIVADFLCDHPHAALKVLLGTDFPIKSSQTVSQLEALRNAGLSTALIETIAANRL